MSLNRCIISGNISYISPIKRSANGITYIKMFVQCVNLRYDRMNDEWYNDSLFIPIIAIGNNARIAERLEVGRMVLIDGQLFYTEIPRTSQSNANQCAFVLVDDISSHRIEYAGQTEEEREKNWHAANWY